MIMEAAMGGELYHYLKKYDKMTEIVARNIILQVVQAMLYCHSRGVVHRDLKLENVMFKNKNEEDLVVKVIDFGIAGVAEEKVDAGTLSYMAPECLEKVAADTSPAIDVWAIGVMFYAMIFGTLPFSAEDERTLVKQIKNDQVKFPKSSPITPEGKEVIKAMLQKDPTKRIELIDLVTQPYNTMEEEEFEVKYSEVKVIWEEQKLKNDEEEEQKLQDQFLA
jgi:serine/threonine protein kinase